MAPADTWTADAIPDLSGSTWIVTGGNSGLGFETARALARRGRARRARLPQPREGGAALARLRAENPRARRRGDGARPREPRLGARLRLGASAASTRACTCLVNNAGVMALPRCETVDGFEMQLGTNHLGHFALTGLLLRASAARRPARAWST